MSESRAGYIAAVPIGQSSKRYTVEADWAENERRSDHLTNASGTSPPLFPSNPSPGLLDRDPPASTSNFKCFPSLSVSAHLTLSSPLAPLSVVSAPVVWPQ